ncbi:MAG: Stp1/IreP family PP2C-type Ser/Thr phosphatase [Clostridiales bacterium]|nr:Stp1/IreP family PP2C-type Ser/Thr phosphatase [Clostridiales bacterium]MBD9159412.1 Stp1/IreP family PP2C-type Ser/Thr phosphatase [Clostridiales bacterium]
MIKAYAKSDVGKVREINEDAFYISNSLDEVQLYMLADGMGGYNGGEIASKLAIQSAKNYIENNFKEIEKDKDSIIQLIGSSIEYANMVVYEKAKENKELSGMGTTLEICLIYNNRAFIGHVGDSRIYRIRKEFMRKLTQDHSYVQKLVKDGTITQEEAAHHPQKNMLMKALGCNAFVEPDVMVKGFLKDDILIMNSDGLTNLVSQEEIFKEAKKNIEQATKNLVQMANDNGGYDNITVIIIKNI